MSEGSVDGRVLRLSLKRKVLGVLMVTIEGCGRVSQCGIFFDTIYTKGLFLYVDIEV